MKPPTHESETYGTYTDNEFEDGYEHAQDGPAEFGQEAEDTYRQVASRLDEFYATDRYDQLAELGVERAYPHFMEYMKGHKVLRVDQTLHAHNNSYKIHGAANATLVAQDAAWQRGERLTTLNLASAGNHGEAAAAVGRFLGLHVEVEAAATASPVKVELMTGHGADVNASHDNLATALDTAAAKGRQPNHTFVPPYNDYDVITGQAVLGVQLYEDLVKQSVTGQVVVPAAVGGGGHLSGLVCGYRYAAERAAENGFQQPFDVSFVGVQMKGGDLARRAVEHKRSGLPYQTIADLFPAGDYDTSNDGTFAVPGHLTLGVLSDEAAVERIVTVDKGAVGSSMYVQSRQLGKHVEPAGALSRAGAERLASEYDEPVTFVTYLTGSNVSPELYEEFMVARRARQAAAVAARSTEILHEQSRLTAFNVGSLTTSKNVSIADHTVTVASSPTASRRQGLVTPRKG